MPPYQTPRSFKANVMSDLNIPKYCYEIDATMLDVYLVLPASQHANITRPVLFTTLDAWTGLLIDLSVQIA